MASTLTPTARQFRRWLRAQADRWDGVGHLAVQSVRDPDWPRDGRLNDLHGHLVRIGAGVNAQRALTAAWAEFLTVMRDRSDCAPAADTVEGRAFPLRDYIGRTEESAWYNGAFADLLCPVCYDNYVHFGEPRLTGGGDAYRAGWGGKGDLITVPLWCESGHAWELCLGFHKGETSVFVHNPRPFTDADRAAFHDGDGRESQSEEGKPCGQ